MGWGLLLARRRNLLATITATGYADVMSWRTLMIAMVLAWPVTMGCTDTSDGDSKDASDSDVQADSPDTSNGLTYVLAPAHCDPPSSLPQDPIALSQELEIGLQGLHLLDIVRDPQSGLLWTVGRGGLFGLSTTSDGRTTIVGKHPKGNGLQVFEHVQPLGDGVIAVTNRGQNTQDNQVGFWGLGFVDATNPSNINNLAKIDLEDAGAMGLNGQFLYVLRLSGSVTVVDVSSPAAPFVAAEVAGLDSPWSIVVSGATAFIADNNLGLVTVDLSDPALPVLGAPVATSGSALGLALDGTNPDVLYLAAGSAGVDVFDISTPAAPSRLANVSVGAAVVSVSADAGVAFATTQTDLASFDMSDPRTPILLGLEPTPSWAMDVVNEGERAWVADWNDVRVYDAMKSSRAPHLALSREALYFTGSGSSGSNGSETQTLTATNFGAAPLTLLGITASDSRVLVDVNQLIVAPGESASVRFTYSEAGGPSLEATVCIASDAPNAAVSEVTLGTASQGSSILIGEAAPDFVLPDVDGNLHTLSDQLGHPVVLVYFATW